MQPNATIWIAVLVCVLGASPLASAQQVLRDTPSHRFIPPGQRPSAESFKTPDYRKAFDTYRQLSRARRDLRKANSQTNDGEPSFPMFDSSADQLSPETKELMKEWSKNSVADVSRQIGQEIVDFNRQLSRSSGLPDTGGTGQPISFDFSRDLLDQYEEAKKTWTDQKRAMNSQYREALKQYQDTWPTEKLPPEQWLEKVQPFINSEILDQLTKVRDYKDGKLSELPDIPSELLPAAPPSPGLSKRLIDSVVKSLDKSGNELIRRAKQMDAKKKKTSWWKKMKTAANSRMKTWNKSITDRTEQYATATQQATRRASGSRTDSTDSSDVKTLAIPAISIVALLLGLGVLFYRWQSTQLAVDQELQKLAEPGAIRDHESLVRTINGIALHRFGRGSQYWHHRHLFEQFHESAEGETPPIDKLYERARYAPNENAALSAEELEAAQRWCKQAGAGGAIS